MRLLLVQVPTSHLGAGEKVYPLGLSRLASRVPKEIEKHALDMNICPDPWLRLKELLEQLNPDIVCLSFRNLDPLAGHHTSYLSSLKTAAELVRTLAPHARIMAGGPAFSLFAERLMTEIPQIDFGIKGEGEAVFDRLLSQNPDVEKIPGLLWRYEGDVKANPPGRRLSMESLPPSDLFLFPPNSYAGTNSYVAAMGIEGKRGCDLRCGYCLYPFLGGTSMRLRSPRAIVDDMEKLSGDQAVNLFHFTDPVVNRPKDHFSAVCREIVNRKLRMSWTGFFREDGFDPENLDLALEAGLAAIYFSGDALSDHGLTLLNKNLTRQDLFNAATLTAERRVLTMCHFLVNLPGDNPETIRESKETLDRLLAIHRDAGNLGAVIFNHVRLYPGAPLTRKLMREGILPPETDLLYPVYHNPEPYRHIIHEFETLCHREGIFSRLEIGMSRQEISQ